MEYQAQKRELHQALTQAVELPAEDFGEALFDELSMRLFEWQYRHVDAYRRLCDSRGRTPGTVDHWRQVPAVATATFKQLMLFAGPESEVAHAFATSGTTQGDNRGRSYFSAPGLALMETSIRVNAARMLFPDNRQTHILVLAPSPQLAPEMIMAWGMERLLDRFGTKESRFLIEEDGLDVGLMVGLLRKYEQQSTPVTLIGASFGFVNLLEGLGAKGLSFALPPGSRTMDAGGYKGRSRELSRDELDRKIQEGFGTVPGMSVNLLGMTELASQFYDDTIGATLAGKAPTGRKQNAPWTRTLVVDPLSLEPVRDGEEGCLVHLDLANLDSPFCVLTDDVGIKDKQGFQVLGRLSADQSRGCSLTIDELTRGNS